VTNLPRKSCKSEQKFVGVLTTKTIFTIVTNVLVVATALVVGYVFLESLPDLRRYIKINSM